MRTAKKPKSLLDSVRLSQSPALEAKFGKIYVKIEEDIPYAIAGGVKYCISEKPSVAIGRKKLRVVGIY